MEGTQFDFSYAPGIAQEQILGFEMAGEIWSQYLTDDVIIEIHVETTNLLPEGVIGGALPAIEAEQSYGSFRSNLDADIISSDDRLAYDNLTGASSYRWLIESEDNWNRGTNNSLSLTKANAKALGMVDGSDNSLDVYILMNDFSDGEYSWSYDYLDRASLEENSVDFLSVAIHEIGHGLGFISGVDSVTEELDFAASANRMNQTMPLDMYRYSQWSKNQNRIDLAYGEPAYFSIDGGQTRLAGFSMGNNENVGYGGDGFQASHWLRESDDIAQGIMDPILEPGEIRNVSRLDLQALDVIGWDLGNVTSLDWQELYNTAEVKAQTSAIADRTADVESMLDRSLIYNGRRGSSGGSWQAGFWQNMKFQRLNVEASSNNAPADFRIGEIAVNNYLSQFNSNFVVGNKSDELGNKIDNELNIEETAVKLIEQKETSVMKSDSLDLSLNSNLDLRRLKDTLYENGELLAMPIN